MIMDCAFSSRLLYMMPDDGKTGRGEEGKTGRRDGGKTGGGCWALRQAQDRLLNYELWILDAIMNFEV